MLKKYFLSLFIMKSNGIIKFIKEFSINNEINNNDFIIKTNIVNIYKKYNIKYIAIDFSNVFYGLINKSNYLVSLIILLNILILII